MRKLRLKEVLSLAQSHLPGKQQSLHQDQHSDSWPLISLPRNPQAIYLLACKGLWLYSLQWLLLGPCPASSLPETAPSLVFTYRLGRRLSGLPAVLALWVPLNPPPMKDGAVKGLP